MKTTAPDPLWTIHATLIAKGFKYERPPLVYCGPLAVHGNTIQVEIDIPDMSFVRMPKVRLLEGASLPVERLAHILDEGGVCYFGQGGLPLDLYDPGGSVLRVLVEAENALAASFAGGAKAEFEAELAAYWRGKSYYVAIPRSARPSIVSAEMLPVRESNDSGIVFSPSCAASWLEKGHLGRSRQRTGGFPIGAECDYWVGGRVAHGLTRDAGQGFSPSLFCKGFGGTGGHGTARAESRLGD
ncbi:MAG: hypothetical protein B7Z43_03830 [Sphingomonas sp. 12-62-6]|nr:MAG: hypothetical protein B7Z43_03830 [Sphingomonas sp. 12-62-6]